jgi:hypothetical protein
MAKRTKVQSSGNGWVCLGVLAVLGGCGDPASETVPSGEAGATCAASSVIVAASDYSSSEVGLLALDGAAHFYQGGSSLGTDPALASSRGRLFWIDRYGGKVIELDPKCATPLASAWSANDDAAAGSDPQDIAVAEDGTLWIARFDVPTILIKSSNGLTSLGTLDLSGIAGRNPYMSSIRIIDGAGGSKAYVTLEMLNDDLVSVDPSDIVKIDVTTRAIEATLQLKGRNPFGLIVETKEALWLAEPGQTDEVGETAAGIERVDLEAFTSKLIVRESDIGASVDQVSITSGCGTAIDMGPGPVNVTSMISFDVTSGDIKTSLADGFLYTDAGFELAGMAWLDGGVNLVGDRTTIPGKGYRVHAVSAASDCTLTERPLSLFAPEAPVALQPVP